jgi:hypothetical protein
MKMADLLGEHGLKWFKSSALLFGILFGISGSLLILNDNILANFFIALLIHWVLRFRIDSSEHGVAGAIMFTTFVLNLNSFVLNPLIFWITLITFSIFGLLNDAADRKDIKGFVAKLAKSQFHFFMVPLILIFFDISYWIILIASFSFIISYEAIKFFFKTKGYR